MRETSPGEQATLALGSHLLALSTAVGLHGAKQIRRAFAQGVSDHQLCVVVATRSTVFKRML